jgi:hypothetical protein
MSAAQTTPSADGVSSFLKHIFEKKNCSIEFINPVRPCLSVRPSVHPSVRLSVPYFFATFNLRSSNFGFLEKTIYEEYGCVFRSKAQELCD